MLNIRNTLFALILSGLFLATSALAQETTPCGFHGEVIHQLREKYKETPVAIGMLSDGQVLEVLASESGSWTIIITIPSGVTCGILEGESWELFPLLLTKGSPT